MAHGDPRRRGVCLAPCAMAQESARLEDPLEQYYWLTSSSPWRAFASPFKAPPYDQCALGERLMEHSLALEVHGGRTVALVRLAPWHKRRSPF
ncbi:hypothetical protein Bca101_006436 [Brassica carinata]